MSISLLRAGSGEMAKFVQTVVERPTEPGPARTSRLEGDIVGGVIRTALGPLALLRRRPSNLSFPCSARKELRLRGRGKFNASHRGTGPASLLRAGTAPSFSAWGPRERAPPFS